MAGSLFKSSLLLIFFLSSRKGFSQDTFFHWVIREPLSVNFLRDSTGFSFMILPVPIH